MALVFGLLIIVVGVPWALMSLAYLVCRFGLPGVIVIGLVSIVLFSVSSLSDVLLGAVILLPICGFLLTYLPDQSEYESKLNSEEDLKRRYEQWVRDNA